MLEHLTPIVSEPVTSGTFPVNEQKATYLGTRAANTKKKATLHEKMRTIFMNLSLLLFTKFMPFILFYFKIMALYLLYIHTIYYVYGCNTYHKCAKQSNGRKINI